MDFWLSQAALLGVYIVLVTSFDIVAARTGILSLAHAALFGVGAYTAALLMLHAGITDVLVLIPAAGVAAAALSLPIALLSLRVRTEYVAVTSLGFALAFIVVVDNIPALGLAEGLVGIPIATLGPIQMGSPQAMTVFSLVVAAAVLVIAQLLMRGRWGLHLAAVRDSEPAAASFGIDPVGARVLAVVVAGFGAGVAGVLFIVYAQFISPGSFDLPTLALIVAMLGLAQPMGVAGYVIGPAVLVGVPAALQYLHVVSLTVLGSVNQMIYGLVMVFAVLLLPRGIGRGRLRRARRPRPATPDAAIPDTGAAK